MTSVTSTRRGLMQAGATNYTLCDTRYIGLMAEGFALMNV